jgi:hypothetical protein
MLHLPLRLPARPAPEGTLGFAQPGRRLAVLDEDGAELPDERDRHAGRPPQRSGPDAGLLDRDGAPDLPLTGDWFETGDRVRAGPTAPSSTMAGATT